jgi:hypothetical protein
VDRRIKIVQLEQVFEPYRMLFKEMKERSNSHQRSAKQRKTKLKKNPLFLGGGGRGQLFADFPFSRGVLGPNPLEKRGMSLL